MFDYSREIAVALLKTTLLLSLAACLGWLVLRAFRARSPGLHRLVWVAVLAGPFNAVSLALPARSLTSSTNGLSPSVRCRER